MACHNIGTEEVKAFTPVCENKECKNPKTFTQSCTSTLVIGLPDNADIESVAYTNILQIYFCVRATPLATEFKLQFSNFLWESWLTFETNFRLI